MRRLLCLAVLGTLVAGAFGCSVWVNQSAEPGVLLSRDSLDLVRVTMLDGTAVEVANPRVNNATLTGLLPGTNRPGAPLATFAAPIDSVSLVAVKERSVSRALSTFGGIPVFLLGSFYLMGF